MNTERRGAVSGPTIGPVVPDGTYDAIIVDAESGSDDDAVLLHLALAGGAHRGEVVTIAARDLHRDPLDLLAVPVTLTVTDGNPEVTLEG